MENISTNEIAPLAGEAKVNWTAPRTVDKPEPHADARSKASGLTPPRWL